jgi:hypothetical protein
MSNRLTRRNYGNGHGYALDGVKVPGVTTVIGKLDKPALVAWAARMSAGYAVDHWDELTHLPIMDRAKKIEDARWDKNRAAVVKGNRIHGLGERLAAGEKVDAPAEVLGQVEAYARFLDTWQLESIHTEASVAHTQYHYAGTLDAIMNSPKLGMILLDIKTGSGVWAEVALQLAAYRYADLLQTEIAAVGPRGGKKAPELVEGPVPEVDGCYVAHVLADTVELLPIRAGEDEFATFLYLREVYAWHEEASNRNNDGYRPPVGQALYPEQIA